MARSGDLIDNKVFEADFFLEKLRSSSADFFAARCYLSAFVASSRSITFAMQAVLSNAPGFKDWYSSVQARLRADSLARYFTTVRNETQKIGNMPLNFGASEWRGDQHWGTKYYFQGGYEGPVEDVPQTDVVSACHEYLTTLVDVVYDCYERFDVLSPLSFFSVANLAAKGMSLDDMEEALGFPRGWTNLPGATDADRHSVLRKQFPDTAIDRLFLRYLGKIRTVIDRG